MAACVSDRVDSALEKLEMQFQEQERRFCNVDKQLMEKQRSPIPILQPRSDRPQSVFVTLTSVRICIWNFREEFRFLNMFLDCTHRWSDADKVVPNLGSLAIKIEAKIQEIGGRLHEQERASTLLTLSELEVAACEKKDLEEWATKLINLFSHFQETIRLLKREVEKVYDSLLSHTVQSHSPMLDYGQWDKFVQSVELNLKIIKETVYFSASLQEQMKDFQEKLKLVRGFLSHLADNFPEHPKVEDVMIHMGRVVFSAALLSCECWIRPMYPTTANNMTNNLLELQLKIDLSSPECVDMNLRLLKTSQAITNNQTVNQVNMFVDCLLSSTTLITPGINISENYNGTVQKDLAYIEAVFMLVKTLPYSLAGGCTPNPMVLKLLAKIWLIKIDVYIMEQRTTSNRSLLPVVEGISVLDHGVRYLELEEGLRFLRTFCTDPPTENAEFVKKILSLMEELARVVASLTYSFHGKEITTEMVSDVLIKLHAEILLFQADSFLMELLNTNESLIAPVKHKIISLHEGLKLLISATNQPEENVEHIKPIFAQIEALCRGIISLCFSFPTKKITEENANVLLSELLVGMYSIVAEPGNIILHRQRCNFPKTNGLGFLDVLLRNVNELLNHKADLISSIRHHIEEILRGLEFLRCFLRDIPQQAIEVQQKAALASHVVEVAYKTENVIDLILVESGAEQQNMLGISLLLGEIRYLKMQVSKIYEKKTNDVRVHNIAQTPADGKSEDSTPRMDDIVIGLNDQEEVIIDRLTRGSLQQDIISIVGMPGIGKTTLARKVYNNPKVVYHFHIRAWCYVSQVYRKKDLLLDLLSHIVELNDSHLEMTDEDLDFQLYQRLKQRRYLIVMDDMWNTGAWEDLRVSFPNDGNGSRILITSRLHDVALKAKPDTVPHPLRLLSDDESWDLLQRKIFHERSCPEELIEVGKQIAKSCKGLPLAIVAIAGILERTDRQEEWWKEIAENLSSRVIDDPQTRCRDILGLSYEHLPDHLKVCFLYFGVFLGDKDIPAWKLLWMWSAEGFIRPIESKSLEDLAEDYLLDLISRSLVIVAKRRSKGGVKACRVHDMLRDLCLSKAKEENFIKLIAGYEDPYASFDGLDYGVDFDYSYPSITYEDHRLCINSKRKHFVMSRPSGPRVRSLLFFATSDSYPRCPYDISFISDNFKLLKVLDFECINMGSSFPSGIGSLIHLRYFAASGDIDSVPSSIANLWKLETFIVKGLKGKVVLPDTIWYMGRLRHLHVNNHAVFSLQVGNFSALESLVTLSSPFLSYGEDTQNIIIRLPNLKKLRCIFSEPRDYSENECCFPMLEFLNQLESLKIVYHGRHLNSAEFSFPLNLKKLTLSNFRLPWDDISLIGRLENLQVLKLLSRAFEGDTWDMREGEFAKLKFLKLDNLNIVQWNASSDHLPNLQQLVLRSCKQLEEVPFSFGDIPTLQIIEVQRCGHSCEESVRRIKEEDIEGLKVLINPSASGFR